MISNDPIKKKNLEELIHPIIKQKVKNFIQKNKEAKIVVVEVPLLFEAKFDRLFNYTIGVSCSNITQLTNLKRRGVKNVNLDLTLNNSNKFDSNAHKCSFLINNDGTLEELKRQVDVIYSQIIESN